MLSQDSTLVAYFGLAAMLKIDEVMANAEELHTRFGNRDRYDAAQVIAKRLLRLVPPKPRAKRAKKAPLVITKTSK